MRTLGPQSRDVLPVQQKQVLVVFQGAERVQMAGACTQGLCSIYNMFIPGVQLKLTSCSLCCKRSHVPVVLYSGLHSELQYKKAIAALDLQGALAAMAARGSGPELYGHSGYSDVNKYLACHARWPTKGSLQDLA